jgi:hypothetical protein
MPQRPVKPLRHAIELSANEVVLVANHRDGEMQHPGLSGAESRRAG